MTRVLEWVFGVRSSGSRPHADPELRSFARWLPLEGSSEARGFGYGVFDFARRMHEVRKPSGSSRPMVVICYHFGESLR